MTETANRTEHEIRWLTREETRIQFDAEARTVMGMSGDECLRRYGAGDFMDLHDEGENIEFTGPEAIIPWGR